jgi:chemotaxis response regulator CheB
MNAHPDIVAIGASSGGLEALQRLHSGLHRPALTASTMVAR